MLALFWSAPPSSQWNGVIIGYNLTCIIDGMTSSMSVSETNQTIVIDPFTNYSCTVRAATIVGDGPATVAISGVTDEDSE